MLNGIPITTTIAVTNLEASRAFYEGVLGLVPVTEAISAEGVLYESAGTSLYTYQTSSVTPGYHPASFTVPDIEAAIHDLVTAGVVFEQYDFPGMQTDELGIAVMGNQKLAWFADPDGTVLSLLEII